MLRACILDFRGSKNVHLLLVEFSYNNSCHSSVRCAPFKALYGRKCRSLIMWAEVGEGQLIGHERKPLEFSVGDYVLLKVSPWKGVVSFGKKEKLTPRFVRPFEIIEKVGLVAYKLRLPEELNGVHDTFHVSNLKKCLDDPTLQVPLDEIQVDVKLNFMEEPMEILEREFKKLKRSKIAIVKVRWNSKSGPEFMWERKDRMKLNAPAGRPFRCVSDISELRLQEHWDMLVVTSGDARSWDVTIKKVKVYDSYEFLVANKKCIIDVEVFRKILDISLRVKGKEFTKVQDDEATLTFLIDLGYKGPLHKYTSMYVDHMHQSWRTLAAIINKCLFRKTIDHKKEKRSRRETMTFLRFTKVIINHFFSQHKSLSKLKFQHYHTIKDDGIVSRLKFIKIGEYYQKYGILIPNMMLNDKIKQSESYQTFLKYSTGQIPPKNSRGKGSQGKKIADESQETIDVSEESDFEPARKKTASRRVIKKKGTISVDDNIIPDPDVALELGKSISLTEAVEEEATRQVHATHARIVTESVPKPARRRPSGIASRDTSSVTKKMSPYPSEKIRVVSNSTSQRTTWLMIQCKHSKKSTVIPATSSEGTGIKPEVLDEEKVSFESKVILKWGSEQESEYSEEDDDDENIEWVDTDEKEEKDVDDDNKSIDLDKTDDEETDDEFMHGEEHVQGDDEETDDEFVHGNEQVNDDEDEEMTNVEVEESGNGDEEISYAAKADIEKTEEVKDDTKKAELPPTSSNLSVFSGFGDQFLKLSSDASLIGTAPTITTVVLESDALTAVQLRVAKLEKDVSELKKIDHSAEALASLKS
ncbi:retrovirus-related pol polyprotein from transposon TNT 1-94 [Tanacetum coccineum]